MENEGLKLSGQEKLVPVSGGDGPQSYFQNSSVQRLCVEATKEVIAKSIKDHLDFDHPNFTDSTTINIADFGCATGPNTFIAVESIITAIDLKHRLAQDQEVADTKQQLEFQVFFNDQPDNDFNTLFKNLPNPRMFFASGVPGSYLDPLFPRSSLHVGHSSFALHWLSRVPQEVRDPSSSAWNRRNIHCSGLDQEVAKAYRAQFERDLGRFLDARAREIVGGGLVAITVPGLPDGLVSSNTTLGMSYDLLGACLMDMAKLGLTSMEKVEAFNLPIYHPPLMELKSLIERNVYFDIAKLQTIPNMPRHARSAPMIASVLKVSLGQVIKQSFGDEVFESVFKKFSQELSANFFITDEKFMDSINVFMLLKRVL